LSAIIAYALMSVVAFAVYGLDKQRAVRGGWRIREATLQAIADEAVFTVTLHSYQETTEERRREEPRKVFLLSPFLVLFLRQDRSVRGNVVD